MANFYQGGSTYGGTSIAPIAPTFPSSKPPDAPAQGDGEPGKGSFGFDDPIGSVASIIGSGVKLGQGLLGGVTGLIGQIGVPGGPNLGDIGELPGGLVDAVGQIGFGDGANIGALPGAALDVVSAPGQFIQQETAKDRLRAQQEGRGSLLAGAADTVTRGVQEAIFHNAAADTQREMALRQAQEAGAVLSPSDRSFLEGRSSNFLPPEFQARLDAGEDINAIAGDMVKQGVGFTSDQGVNLLSSVVLDPMNLVGSFAGKAGAAVKGAGLAVDGMRAADSIGVSERFIGAAYNAASRGLSAGGAKLMDGLIGPTTSGVFHAIGDKPYRVIRTGLGKLAPEYSAAYDDAFATGAAQLPYAVIAKDASDELIAAIAERGQKGFEALRPTINIEARVRAARAIPGNRVERDAEELLGRVKPDFLGHTDEGRFVETRGKLAHISGSSEEDAARVLGGKADIQTAQHVNMAFYGKAGGDLNEAKAASAGSKVIDASKVTIIGPEQLTDELAQGIEAGTVDLVTAVDQFSVLRNRFGGTAFAHSDVLDFVRKLIAEKALPSAVKAATTGRAKLPPALARWRQTYGKFGYTLGFEPEDGMKIIMSDDGLTVVHAAPWVPFVSEATPLTVRNPLGRFMDSVMRASSQTSIILDSRDRMVKFTRGTGLSANQARAIHRDIIQTAAERRVSPRGLSGTHGELITFVKDNGRTGQEQGNVFEAAFARHMTPEEFTAFRQAHNPTYMVMRAFEGNLSRVGLTQKFTGMVKSQSSRPWGSTMIPQITDYVYPKIRFELSALFQMQEKIESPALNALRGVRPTNVDEGVRAFYDEMSKLPDFKFLTEAAYVLNISGGEMVGKMLSRQGKLGQAVARFANVKGGKERARIAQVLSENPERFQEAVTAVNPRLWRHMVTEYGTDDARVIAERYMTERVKLSSGIDEAMEVFDGAKVQAAYDAGEIAKGQALNAAVGKARGANGAGGAMKLTDAELAKLGEFSGADAETVWQAFRESFRQSSMQAFKTHYFNPERGWLERTINHPYLGLYPASYMWGKVLPEFGRFLLKRPFGLNVPLTGFAAFTRVQEQMAAWVATDPGFAKAVEDNKDFIYLIDLLLPGDPLNLPANAPAWARHLAEDQLAGRKLDPEKFASREFEDSFNYAVGPVRSAKVGLKAAGDLADAAGDIFANLTKSAAEYDQFVLPPR